MLNKTSMLFINHPLKYQCAHTTIHRGQGECVTVMRCEISDRTVSSSILQCEDWRPNSTKFYRLWLTSTPHIYAHIFLNIVCTYIFMNALCEISCCLAYLSGNMQYANLEMTLPPPHINSAHFFFLMHLLHLMAHQQLLFKAWELLLSFSISLSLTDSAPPWLLIHPVQRGIYHTMVWLSHFQVSNQIPVHHTVMTETKKADICHKDRWRGRFTLCILV